MAGNFRFGSLLSVWASARDRHPGLRPKPISLSSPWVSGLCFSLIVITAPVAVVNSQVPYNGGLPGVEHSSSGFPGLPENANPHPDRNRILEDAMHLQLDQKRLTMINVARQKEMTTDTAKLVALATEVKAETDKSGKDALSAIELHKVEQIEKLAHTVREKMSASVVN